MPPKKAPKRRAPRAAAAPTAEPEVLNGAAVGHDPLPDEAPPRRAPMKTDDALDDLAELLGEDQSKRWSIEGAICKLHGGDWTPDRELSVLKMIKGDERFVITGAKGDNLVELAGAASVVTVTQATQAPPAEPAKTLGEHVADAQGRPQKIPWTHKLGSSVLYLSAGGGAVKARIKNIADHGAYAHYDLVLEAGLGEIDGVEAWKIGRDLSAEGEMAEKDEHIALLERHRLRGRDMAQRHAEMAVEEKRLAEVLSKHRKGMDELVAKMVAHNRAEPGQTDLLDIVGDGAQPGPSRGEKMASEPSAHEDKLAEGAAIADGPKRTIAERVAAGDVLVLEETGLSIDQLLAASFNQATASTGKPQKLKPVDLGADLGPHVVGDTQDGIAVLLALHTKAQWQGEMQDTYGFPLDVPSQDAPSRLLAGGRLTGQPVRVGRGVCYVGHEADAVLVRLPPEEAKPSGKDAAAGS